MAEEEKEVKEGKEERKGGKKGLFVFLALFILLAAAGGGAYFFFLKGGEEEDKKAKEVERKPAEIGVMFDLGTFIVNLADPGVEMYAKVSITLELSDQEVTTEVEKRLPIVKDAVIDILSSKTYGDIRTPEGKERLRFELIKRINTILVKGGVRNLYFTEFVVQST